MKANTKNAIILVISVLVLSCVAFCLRYLPNKSDTEKDLKTDNQSINIISENIKNINSIDIINNYGEYNFVKDSNLVIKDLVNYQKNKSAYKNLSDKVCNLVADKIVSESDIDFKLYGFDSPQAKINIKYNNNLEINLLVGNSAPGNIGYYVTKQDTPIVYLVSDDIISVFLKSKLDYISLNIISPKSDDEAMKDLEYLEILNNNQKIKKYIILLSRQKKEFLRLERK